MPRARIEDSPHEQENWSWPIILTKDFIELFG
jgi:hypothetical protein